MLITVVNLPSPEGVITDYDKEVQSEAHDKSKAFICYCGKNCKGIRGLRAHQRFCHIQDLPDFKELFANEPEADNHVNDINFEQPELAKFDIKDGIKLPKSQKDWDLANNYFRTKFDVTKEITDIDSEVQFFQATLYEYFCNTHGTVRSECTNDLHTRYDNLSRRQLKRILKELKDDQNVDNSRDIQYIAKLIRLKYSKKTYKTSK